MIKYIKKKGFEKMNSIKALEDLINSTQNGIYDYDYSKNFFSDEVYKYTIKVNSQTTIIEVSKFLKELSMWMSKYYIKDFQVLIRKDDCNE